LETQNRSLTNTTVEITLNTAFVLPVETIAVFFHAQISSKSINITIL